MTSAPKLLSSKTAELSKFTEGQLKKMTPAAEQYLPSPLHSIFSKSFDALRGSRSQELSDNWTQDLASSLTKYLGWNKSQKPKSKL
jgi:hypothetical protein